MVCADAVSLPISLPRLEGAFHDDKSMTGNCLDGGIARAYQNSTPPSAGPSMSAQWCQPWTGQDSRRRIALIVVKQFFTAWVKALRIEYSSKPIRVNQDNATILSSSTSPDR
jgi:hypothetical protein